MSKPEFPAGFYNHCPKVVEAKDWMRILGNKDNLDPKDFAECAFHSAGCGLACENCKLHLTRPFLGHKLDEEWLPRLEEYYRMLADHDYAEEVERKRLQEALLEQGSGI